MNSLLKGQVAVVTGAGSASAQPLPLHSQMPVRRSSSIILMSPRRRKRLLAKSRATAVPRLRLGPMSAKRTR